MCVDCDLAEPESLASLGGSAPGLVDGILSSPQHPLTSNQSAQPLPHLTKILCVPHPREPCIPRPRESPLISTQILN